MDRVSPGCLGESSVLLRIFEAEAPLHPEFMGIEPAPDRKVLSNPPFDCAEDIA